MRLLSIWTTQHAALHKQHANAAPHDLLSHKKFNTPCKTHRKKCLDGSVEQSSTSGLTHLCVASCWGQLHCHPRSQPQGAGCLHKQDLLSQTAWPDLGPAVMQCGKGT